MYRGVPRVKLRVMVGECVGRSYGDRHHHTTFLALFSRQLPVGGCRGWFGVRVRRFWFGCLVVWFSGPAVLVWLSEGLVFEFGWCDLPCGKPWTLHETHTRI